MAQPPLAGCKPDAYEGKITLAEPKGAITIHNNSRLVTHGPDTDLHFRGGVLKLPTTSNKLQQRLLVQRVEMQVVLALCVCGIDISEDIVQ